MAQVKEIKRHIGSVNKIRQITKAMYAISLTRVFKSKQQLFQVRAYSQAQLELMRDVIGDIRPDNAWLNAPGQGRYVFVVNSDRGLCGRFKGDLNRKADSLLRQDPDAKLILGGEKANVYFRQSSYEIAKTYSGVYDKPRYAHAEQIGQELMSLYGEHRIPIDLVYMRFINDFRQVVEVERLLPLSVPPDQAGEPKKTMTLYEPSKDAVFEGLVPQYVKVQLYRILLESKTSEHAIRRQSMRSATDNADELIRDLTLLFNKARQQEITKQLLDIMGGAEALRQM